MVGGAEELNSHEEIEILNKQATQIKTGITELFPLAMEDGCVLFQHRVCCQTFPGEKQRNIYPPSSREGTNRP